MVNARYKVVIAEDLTFRQFVAEISAEDENAAKILAKKMFLAEHPAYSAHYKVIMVNKIL